MKQVNRSALLGFDELPDSAFVRLPVVAALFAISHSTVWRWSRLGYLPNPRKINGITVWRVGLLREVIASSLAGTKVPEGINT